MDINNAKHFWAVLLGIALAFYVLNFWVERCTN